jgi:hypothetical protein
METYVTLTWVPASGQTDTTDPPYVPYFTEDALARAGWLGDGSGSLSASDGFDDPTFDETGFSETATSEGTWNWDGSLFNDVTPQDIDGTYYWTDPVVTSIVIERYFSASATNGESEEGVDLSYSITWVAYTGQEPDQLP